MTGHHLVLGELEDYLTGEIIEDNHDEQYRQKLARLLVEKKGYDKKEIIPRTSLTVGAGESKGIIPVDFKIEINGKIGMIIKYAPGSLVTRHRPVTAVSRLAEPYQIPVAVVTNGEDADVLDGSTCKETASGLDAIPSRSDLIEIMEQADFKLISERRAEMESRIVYCYEIDGACPCDTTVCRIDS